MIHNDSDWVSESRQLGQLSIGANTQRTTAANLAPGQGCVGGFEGEGGRGEHGSNQPDAR